MSPKSLAPKPSSFAWPLLLVLLLLPLLASCKLRRPDSRAPLAFDPSDPVSLRYFATRLDDEKPSGADQRERLEIVTAKWHALRSIYGALHCSVHDIGPTGGFCLKAEAAVDVGGNSIMAEGLCDMAVKLVGPKGSLLDMGAGFGQYGKCVQSKDPSIKWVGVDGAENIVAATKGRVGWKDLTAHVDLGSQFDWVMSLEVGEHLPKRFEQVYIDNVVRHARKGVLTSWGVPGQGGHHHVNLLPNEYVLEQYAKRGFVYDEAASEAGRASAGNAFWFNNTFMVFHRRT